MSRQRKTRTAGTKAAPCVWCQLAPGVTRDEVFPHSIGGTLELALPACGACQTAISRAEVEVARRSELALHRVRTPDARPRHPERPTTSGMVRPRSIFSKAADGRLVPTIYQVGRLPRCMPSLAIDLVTPVMSFWGPEEYDVFRRELSKRRDDLDSIPVEIVDHPEVAADPQFRPCLSLAGPEGLLILARSNAEAAQIVKIVRTNIQRILARQPVSRTTRVRKGDKVFAQLSYNEVSILRVATKVALGTLMFARPDLVPWPGFAAARAFILRHDLGFEGARIVVEADPDRRQPWPPEHVAVVQPEADGVATAAVILYSLAFVVQLGPAPEDFTRVAARCGHSRGPARLVEGDGADTCAEEVASAIETALGVSLRVAIDPAEAGAADGPESTEPSATPRSSG